ncbi:MAG TPA: hypothetical protein DCS35_10995 [Vibrio sp.]|nr:hypothetical protein [Vibrio sp.]
MSTQRSLQSLIDRAKSTLITHTGQNNPAINAIACAIAGVTYGQYGYQDQLFRELHPETCSEPWLHLHASRHKAPRLLPTFAKGSVRFTALGPVVVVPKGTTLTSPAGNEYETIKEQNSDSDIDVIALSSGTASNLPTGSTLTLTEGISGIDPNSVQCLGIDGGADIEALEHWRARVVLAFGRNITIGRAEDYVEWAISAHADIDFAWVQDNTPERGMVQVLVGTRKNDPTVTPEVINAVQENFEANRLAGCHPIAQKPIHAILNIEIQGIEDTVIREDVVKALQGLVQSKMGKVRKLDKDTRQPESITPTEIVITVSTVTNNFIIRSPVDEVSITKNQIHVLGAITWTAPI